MVCEARRNVYLAVLDHLDTDATMDSDGSPPARFPTIRSGQ
jgi:hypothetical protein